MFRMALFSRRGAHHVSQPVLDSWGIPNGMWGEGRTDAVPGAAKEAAAAIAVCSQFGDVDDAMASSSADSASGSGDQK